MFAIRARNKITERCGKLVDICIPASRLHFWILFRVYFRGWKEIIHAGERYNGGDEGREWRLIAVRSLNLMVSRLFQSRGILEYPQAPVTYFSPNKLPVESAFDYTNIIETRYIFKQNICGRSLHSKWKIISCARNQDWNFIRSDIKNDALIFRASREHVAMPSLYIPANCGILNLAI